MPFTYKILPAETILKSLQHNLSLLRVGRINASVLDHVRFAAYGDQNSAIADYATITIPEPRQLLITPYDQSLISKMEKAIRESDLGVNPINKGNSLLVVFPPLTTEQKTLEAKKADKYGEEAKILLRRYRQEKKEEQKNLYKEKQLSEDEFKRFEEALQKEVDSLTKEIEQLVEKKKEEIMKV